MRINFLAIGVGALCVLPLGLPAQNQFIINTFAGGGPNHIPGVTAPLGNTFGVVVDASGNIYFSSITAHRVFKLDTSSIVSVVAGYGVADKTGDGGLAINAGLNTPQGLALSGNLLYIADTSNNRVRVVNLTTGVIANFAGNGSACNPAGGSCGDGTAATGAQLNQPTGVAVDNSGNVYIADLFDQKIRIVDTSGNILTFAGDGIAGFKGDGQSASAAEFNTPAQIAIDTAGAFLYVADYNNHRIRQISLTGTHTIQTVVNQALGTAGYSGDGNSAFQAQIRQPRAIAFDKNGNMYFAEEGNNVIRKVLITGGVIGNISTVAGKQTLVGGFAGDGGIATQATLNIPGGVTVDTNLNIIIADRGNSRIRRVTIGNNQINTIAGNGVTIPTFGGDGGPAVDAILFQPIAQAVDSQGNIYIADFSNQIVRKVDTTGVITTIAGTPNSPCAVSTSSCGDGSAATSAQLNGPAGVAIGTDGSIYIAEYNNHKIRRISGGIISTYAGTGAAGFGPDNVPAATSKLNAPLGVAIDNSNNIYIADSNNNVIRKVTASSQQISTLVGTPTIAGSTGDGAAPTGANARLNRPTGVTVNSNGQVLYIADQNNNKIRWVSNSILDTFAGTGVAGFSDGISARDALLKTPFGVTLDQPNNLLYIGDLGNSRTRLVAGGDKNNIISTVAGSNARGFGGDQGLATAALLADVSALGIDGSGKVYNADFANNRVRVLSVVCTYVLGSSSQSVLGTGGGPFTVSVTVAAGCPWTISVLSGIDWITVNSGTNSTGPGNASFTVAANLSGAARSTILTIAGKPFTVSEAVGASFTISGQVTSSGAALAGVTIATIIGGSTITTTSAAGTGNYSFTSLPAGGNYTMTPSLANYTFAPASSTFNNLQANQAANFVGTANQVFFTISGQVTKLGSALAGVTLTLTGGSGGTRTSDGSGNYSFASLAGGVNYTVTPSLASHSFTPASAVINNLASNVIANFSAAISTGKPDKVGTTYSGYSVLDANGNFAWDGTSTDKLISWSTFQTSEKPIYGDWNGDGKTKVGVYNNGTWLLDYNGNGVWDGPTIDKAIFWSTGQSTDVPVLGDWNGDGRTKIGIYNNGTWILDYNGNGVWEGPGVDKTIYWSTGQAGEVPVVGDWNGDGKTKIGIYSNGTWILDYNGNYAWDGTGVDKLIYFGGQGYRPMVGDWNGSGWAKIGAYHVSGTWALDYNGNFVWDGTSIDRLTFFGGPDWLPVVGDWSGSGTTKIGAYTGGQWALDYNGNFGWDVPPDRLFSFGAPGQTPIVGKW